MKIFLSQQIKEIDRYTIANEPIPSIDLMERASGRLFEWITNHFDRSQRFMIFAGPGNNGGDGLALARLLSHAGYKAEAYFIRQASKVSHDCQENCNRLLEENVVPVINITVKQDLPHFQDNDIIVDAIFGSGLDRPIEGLSAEVVNYLNSSGCKIISVDIPSGLFGEDNGNISQRTIIKADHTLTLQFPKLSLMFSENYPFVGIFHMLPIGLHPKAILDFQTPYYLTQLNDIIPLIKTRGRFDHKGNFGHGLLIAGSFGKTGAAVLAAKASLRTGIGLITCHLPLHCAGVLQSSLPEVMVQTDFNHQLISKVENAGSYDAIGVGPGIGTADVTQSAFYDFMKDNTKPVVIDADGLNILSLNQQWLSLIKPGTILTPHPKEFERLAGKFDDGYSRMMGQVAFSEKYKCIVILKGANTSVSTPDGNVYFNSTGNPGMATGGSGDVLTGIILSLLAQGYAPEKAAIAGVFIHGLAGDIAAEKTGFESLIASDIIDNIGNAFNRIRSNTITIL